MEKFGVSFGGGPSKKDLLDTIESQKKQLVQYQTRFKDVVRAYKSLLKEKEALEASLKVLTVSQEVDLSQPGAVLEHPLTSDLADDRCSLHSEDSLDTAASGSTKGDPAEEDGSADAAQAGPAVPSPSQQSEEASGSESGISSSSSGGAEQQRQQQQTPPAAGGEAAERRALQLKLQLSTLTSSLATVTQEKSRMEASFQADKRKMKQELEEAQAGLEEARRLREAGAAALQQQLAESKARVITQQHERAQEQGDHALMLRELQKLLQEERGLRQDAELRLEDAREALAETAQAADRALDCQARLKEVAQEREEMRRSLRAAEAERSKPDPRVEEMQQELAQLKVHFQQQLQHEIRKVAQADERLREQAQLEESRVASLEERASELSALLGACERARQKDQQSAQRLRERLLQLDTENKTLAIAASARACPAADLGLDEASLDVNVLRDKLERVKKLLQLAAQRAPHQDQPPEIEKLGGRGADDPSDGEKASALYYQQELRQLKEEFERYKARAQVVLKNKNAKDGSQARELEEARGLLAELKEKYVGLRVGADEAEARHGAALDERRQEAAGAQRAHRRELERLAAQHREGALRLEEELHKQRDRAAALLAEKDQELERLRAAAAAPDVGAPRHPPRGGSDAAPPDDGEALDESDAVARALRLAGPGEPAPLLYAEQLARREVEVGELRRQRRCLEDDARRLRGELAAGAERHGEEAAELRARLEERARDRGRDGANLEYLKNVIYRFLTLQDARGRQQTLTAIVTILHFSPQEKQAVVKQQAQSWWASGVR